MPGVASVYDLHIWSVSWCAFSDKQLTMTLMNRSPTYARLLKAVRLLLAASEGDAPWGRLLLAGAALMLPTCSWPASVNINTAIAVQTALASGQPVLIEFGAETCSQCKRMKVVLDGISRGYQGRAQIVQVNVNRDKGLTRQLKIMVIPTLVFFDAKGREVDRRYGYQDEVKVAQKLHELGAR